MNSYDFKLILTYTTVFVLLLFSLNDSRRWFEKAHINISELFYLGTNQMESGEIISALLLLLGFGLEIGGKQI